MGLSPWSRAVAASEARVIRVVLPVGERVPPLILRAMTRGRRLRSAALLVCGTPSSGTKVKSSS